MAKNRKPAAAPKVVQHRQRYAKWDMPAQLKASLRAHSKWPYLKPSDWRPLAREVLGPEDYVRSDDRRYNMINKHCANA